MNEANMCGDSAIPPKQMSQTEKQFNIATDNAKMLYGSISLLSEKLKPILRDKSQDTGVGDCKKEEALVPMAESFRKLGSEIMFANGRIRGLLDRLEI